MFPSVINFSKSFVLMILKNLKYANIQQHTYNSKGRLFF